jgi:uncharacterized protein YpmS
MLTICLTIIAVVIVIAVAFVVAGVSSGAQHTALKMAELDNDDEKRHAQTTIRDLSRELTESRAAAREARAAAESLKTQLARRSKESSQ